MRAGSARSLRPTLLVAAGVVVLDQLTKHWAVNRLSGGRDIDLIGSLRFHLTYNSGMAFSRGQGLGPIIGIVAVLVVVVLLRTLRREGSLVTDIATGMVIGGALGNIVDRLFRGDGWMDGSVIDFIDVQWWPIFNVADMAVTIGGVLLVVSTLFIGQHSTAGPDEPVEAPGTSPPVAPGP